MELQKTNECNISLIRKYLHLALKAGKIRLGMYASCLSCLKHKAELILCAGDMSNNSKQKIEKVTRKNNVKLVFFENKQYYSDIFQRGTTGLVCIEDKNFASGIIKVLA